MNVDFIPSVAIACALAACALLPVLLLALSHGALKVAAPGRRFIIAAVFAWGAWLAVLPVTSPDVVDLVTSVLLLATATLAGFTLWTLVAWGFTVSMLLALSRANEPLSVDEWALEYTRGKPIDAFARDRLGVLFKLGLAETHGDAVVMTPIRGRAMASCAGMLRNLFGLRT